MLPAAPTLIVAKLPNVGQIEGLNTTALEHVEKALAKHKIKHESVTGIDPDVLNGQPQDRDEKGRLMRSIRIIGENFHIDLSYNKLGWDSEISWVSEAIYED